MKTFRRCNLCELDIQTMAYKHVKRHRGKYGLAAGTALGSALGGGILYLKNRWGQAVPVQPQYLLEDAPQYVYEDVEYPVTSSAVPPPPPNVSAVRDPYVIPTHSHRGSTPSQLMSNLRKHSGRTGSRPRRSRIGGTRRPFGQQRRKKRSPVKKHTSTKKASTKKASPKKSSVKRATPAKRRRTNRRS